MKSAAIGRRAVTVIFYVAVPALSVGADCNGNSLEDSIDLAQGSSLDCNANLIPDECDRAAGTLSFELPRLYLDSEFARLISVVDLSNDGLPDLLIANHLYEEVSVLPNRGDGTFSSPRVLATGKRFMTQAVDLDGDQDLDLVAGDDEYESRSVIVQLNRGNGEFDPPENFASGSPSISLHVADLDGNGRPEVLLLSTYSSEFSVLWNRGDGSFDAPVSQELLALTTSLVAVDLDGDDDTDLAVAESGTWDFPGNSLVVFLNRGSGTQEFADGGRYAVGRFPGNLVAADLNGDGIEDLMTANASSSTVSILIGHGDGTFADAVDLETGPLPYPIAIADFEEDGQLDFATSGSSPSNYLSVRRNRGHGVFSPREDYPSLGSTTEILTVDLNGDGRPELVTGEGSAQEIQVFQNMPEGRFIPSALSFGGGVSGYVLKAADLDLDGDKDLLVSSGSGTISVLLNASGQPLKFGCAEFLRGDSNEDGRVSISDVFAIRHAIFDLLTSTLPCDDAGDATDDERIMADDILILLDLLFGSWEGLPAPWPAPGRDLTPGLAPPARPRGCREYSVTPATETADVIRLGSAEARPGEEFKVPIFLQASVPATAVQLVLELDPAWLDVSADSLSMSYEGSFYEGFFGKDFEAAFGGGLDHAKFTYGTSAELSLVAVHPNPGVITVAIAGHLYYSGFEVPPGDEQLLGWLHLRANATAAPGSRFALGSPNVGGVGPYGMRTELSFLSEGRFTSALPRVEPASITIGTSPSFVRGDSNGDGKVDLSDAVAVLGHLFLGNTDLHCLDAADADDSGKVEITDAIFLLSALFLGTKTIPAPYPSCGPDLTRADGPGCAQGCR